MSRGSSWCSGREGGRAPETAGPSAGRTGADVEVVGRRGEGGGYDDDDVGSGPAPEKKGRWWSGGFSGMG